MAGQRDDGRQRMKRVLMDGDDAVAVEAGKDVHGRSRVASGHLTIAEVEETIGPGALNPDDIHRRLRPTRRRPHPTTGKRQTDRTAHGLRALGTSNGGPLKIWTSNDMAARAAVELSDGDHVKRAVHGENPGERTAARCYRRAL
ncbi:hypothetical protein [Streptomyces sp. NPDC059651]|uniref:hypothetical protein n=1 Tax=Streptomyces sp. NPDC059651 TaxID=3346897 RepID=UPI003674A04B